MDSIIFVLVISLGVFFLFIILLGNINSKKERFKNSKLVNDEIFYDAETGKKYSLEEAEKGLNFEGIQDKRIISKEKIEEFYHDDEKEMIYLNNFLIENKFKGGGFISGSIKNCLKQSILLQNYKSFRHKKNIQVNKNGYVFFYDLEYEIQEKYNRNYYSEIQMIAVICDLFELGHTYIAPLRLSSLIINSITPEKELIIEGHNVQSFDEVDENSLRKLCLGLKKIKTEFEAETIDKFVFIKIPRKANIEDFKKLLDVMLFFRLNRFIAVFVWLLAIWKNNFHS